MKFSLTGASEKDVERLIKYKLATTIQPSIDEEEKTKITNFVASNMPKQISTYQLIVVENHIVGCLRVVAHKDGVLVDEIFIEKEFRNKGIGTAIFNMILKENKVIYLWVYTANVVAKRMYKKLGFKTVLTDNFREFMEFSN